MNAPAGRRKSIATALQKQIGATLRALRERAGLRQSDLARAIGKSQPVISRMETGQRRTDAVELHDWCVACGHTDANAILRLPPHGPYALSVPLLKASDPQGMSASDKSARAPLTRVAEGSRTARSGRVARPRYRGPRTRKREPKPRTRA